MPDTTPPSWEPESQKMGNWRAMFDQGRSAEPPVAPSVAQNEVPREAPASDEALSLDLSIYRPWILQRGRSRPAMMLEFRRYEPRSGLWTGWAIAYPHLVTLEYIGDKMLSLDFGTRQYVLEGAGLDELARHLQQGSVIAIQEYAAAVWPRPVAGSWISAIRKLGDSKPPP